MAHSGGLKNFKCQNALETKFFIQMFALIFASAYFHLVNANYFLISQRFFFSRDPVAAH